MTKHTIPWGTPRLRRGPFGLEKLCSVCLEWWLIGCFTSHPDGVAGRDNRCKACRTEMRRKRYVPRYTPGRMLRGSNGKFLRWSSGVIDNG